jgi:hypothetical protein
MLAFKKILRRLTYPPWVLFLSSFLTFGLLFSITYLSFKVRAYANRYRECVSAELLADLETVFHFDFPDGVKEVKAAKTRKTPASLSSQIPARAC